MEQESDHVNDPDFYQWVDPTKQVSYSVKDSAYRAKVREDPVYQWAAHILSLPLPPTPMPGKYPDTLPLALFVASNLMGYPGGLGKNANWGGFAISRPDPAICRLDYTPVRPGVIYPSIQSDDSPYYHLGQPRTFLVIGFHPERIRYAWNPTRPCSDCEWIWKPIQTGWDLWDNLMAEWLWALHPEEIYGLPITQGGFPCAWF